MNFTGTKLLETERLVLKRMAEDDTVLYYKEILSDKERLYYLDWDCAADIDEAKAIVNDMIARYHEGDYFFWVIREKSASETVGYIWVCRSEKTRRLAELEYVMCKDAEGHGYMTEAVRRVLDYLLSEVGYFRVEAVCNVENAASAKVMEKAGMIFEGVLRGRAKRKNAAGNPGDLRIFAALPSDIKNKKEQRLF
jgi:RimJ/RimL family protein N-acetyltransferase